VKQIKAAPISPIPISTKRANQLRLRGASMA